MGKNIFKEIINEEFIEVNKSVPETIQCLRAQIGGCRCTIPRDMRIFFNCSKKGKISVYSFFDNQRRNVFDIYYVNGKVISIDNKTYVKINSVYKRIDFWLKIFSLILSVLILPIFLILYSYISIGTIYVPALLISFALLIILQINSIKLTLFRKKNGLKIIELMENEIKKRVQNIEKWDK